MPAAQLKPVNTRREDRDEVHFRITSADADGHPLPLLLVNISPNGMMARCDAALAPGATLTVRLPDLRPIRAVVRWSMGGRIGCEFAAAIAPYDYPGLLAKLRA